MPRLYGIELDVGTLAVVVLVPWSVAYAWALTSLCRWTHDSDGSINCGKCRYSLDGLASDASCPECGSSERRGATRKLVGPARRDFIFPFLGLVLGLVLPIGVDRSAYVLTAWSIIADGFHPPSAWAAASHRSPDAYASPPPEMYPFLAACFSPLLIHIKRPRMRWTSLTILMLSGFVAGVLSAADLA